MIIPLVLAVSSASSCSPEPAPPPKRATAPEALPPRALSALEAAKLKPGVRVPPPTARLEAADELCGVFPLPTGTRYYRKVGKVSQFRVVASLDALKRFYRRYGFTVFDGKGGVTVHPKVKGTDDILSIQARSGSVHVLVVNEGSNPE